MMVPAFVTPSFHRWLTRSIGVEPGSAVLGLAEQFLPAHGAFANRRTVWMSRFSSCAAAARDSPRARHSCTAAYPRPGAVGQPAGALGRGGGCGHERGRGRGRRFSGPAWAGAAAARRQWWCAATVFPAASHRFFHRWNLSATWIAWRALQSRVPSAYAPARSRHTTPDLRVLADPRGQRAGLAVRQHVHRPVAVHIDQDRVV